VPSALSRKKEKELIFTLNCPFIPEKNDAIMSQKENSNLKQFIFFYVMIVYVFVFLFWWSFLLYTKTEQHYIDTLKFESLRFEMQKDSEVSFTESDLYKETYSKFQRQKIMIIAEGSVFFLILILGMIKIRHSFLKEVEIARQQKNFILSITHEFKSPLSSIKLMSETILKRDLPKEKQQQLLTNSLDEIDRLENLVENILLAAKIENNKYGFSMEMQNLSALVNELAEKFQISKKKSIVLDVEENIMVHGDKSALISILLNLIENASKYAPESSAIKVHLHQKNDRIFLSVADKGKGITDIEKEKVFDKFYRIGNEETRKSKGTGLGLYIVKQLVEYHNGAISIQDNQPTGTIFCVEFPAV
jgi:two-component system, OmpR family, phosphate regulon sensor histidine kinase PhoR